MLERLDAWLRTAAERIHDEAPHLTQLDQAIGDGDHGINMDRGLKAIVAALDGRTAPDPDLGGPQPGDQAATAELLRVVGRTLISTVGGASGPLYGTAFLRASAAIAGLTGSPTGGDAIAAALDGAVTGISGLGKSAPGEKTVQLPDKTSVSVVIGQIPRRGTL